MVTGGRSRLSMAFQPTRLRSPLSSFIHRMVASIPAEPNRATSSTSTYDTTTSLAGSTGAGRMRASSRKLAIALAERLGDVVPPPLTLRAEGGGVSIYADGVLQRGSHSPRRAPAPGP